jgi:hypothetical protein
MTSNICTILEQRRQLALLRKPANRYEGVTNPYEYVPSIYDATSSNNFIKISGSEYRILNGNYKLIDLIDNLNFLTNSQGYLWSNSTININNSTGIVVFNSSANKTLGLSSGSTSTSVYNGLNAPSFPVVIDSGNNIIKLDNISFSISTATYANITTLLAQLNSLTNNYGYSWSVSSLSRLIITKNSIYTNLITLTNTNSVSISTFSSTIVGLGFQSGSINSSEYTGIIPPTMPLIIESTDNIFTIDGIMFTMSEATFFNTSNLIAVLNEQTEHYGYNWSLNSSSRLKITKSNLISVNVGSTLFGISSGSFVSPCVLPIPSPPEGSKAPGYTKAQLDMRRKTEILQYRKSNSQKTGQLTKKGKYAKLFTVAGNNSICPLDIYLPTPTSSSNVPGPITILQYNESVPLYNYASDADNYANLNPDINTAFESYSENNILVVNNSIVKIASLLINNPTNLTRTFNIAVPIGLYVSAKSISNDSVYQAFFRIIRITLGIYYNGTLVPGTSTIYTAFSNKYVSFTSNTNITVFSGVSYVGTIYVPVTLDTQKGFVYELRMSAITELSISTMGASQDMVFGAFANVSNNLSPINCQVVFTGGSPNPPVNPGKLTIT